MNLFRNLACAMWSLALTLTADPALAADYPAPREGSWLVRDFRFQTGEILPELRLLLLVVSRDSRPSSFPSGGGSLGRLGSLE
jgi:homoserine O-acetyltransferase